MPRSSPLLTSFNAGEWSPLLHGRPDLAKYTSACRRLENMIATAQGPALRRPGTRFVAETKASGRVRLIPFQFSTQQAYVIEAGALYFRFYKDAGRIEDPPGTPVEIATPYEEADLAGLKWAQSADVLFLVHPDHAPRKLSRTSHTSWTLAAIDFVDGPYLDENLTAATIAPSATTGSGITLTASTDIFQPEHVGSLWRIAEKAGHLNYDAWAEGTSYTSGSSKVTHANRVFVAASTGSSGKRPPLHSKGTESDGGVTWTYLHNGHGWAKITAYSSATQVTAEVIGTLPDAAATTRWREGAWSAVRGYPAAIAFYEERLGFANSRFQPQTCWLSASGAYETFAPTDNASQVLDDTAMTFTIADNQVNAIRWLAPGKVLTLGTIGGEFTVQASNLNEALTPNNVTVRGQSTIGTADSSPLRIGNAVLFVQRAGRRLYEVAYRFDTDSYGAPEMTLLAQHLTRGGMKEIVWQQQPWATLWVVGKDGSFAALTYLRDQDVVGWHRHSFGGTDAKAISAATVPAAEQDRLWLATERRIEGTPRRYVEYLADEFWPEPASAKDDAFFVDCGLTYDGWNDDPTRTLALTGGPPWTVGDSKTLAASGHAPFGAQDVGRVFRFRREGDVWPAVSVAVQFVQDPATALVTLLDDVPSSLQGQTIDWWGRATTSVGGLSHLEGETIQLLADGATHPDRTVVDGQVALDRPSVAVQAGLAYESRLETLDLEAGAADGTALAKPRRIHRVAVRLFGSLGCEVGYEAGLLEEVPFRGATTPMDSSPALFTGDKTINFPKGWDRAAHVLIRQRQPLPLTVVAIAPRLTTNDG